MYQELGFALAATEHAKNWQKGSAVKPEHTNFKALFHNALRLTSIALIGLTTATACTGGSSVGVTYPSCYFDRRVDDADKAILRDVMDTISEQEWSPTDGQRAIASACETVTSN